MASKGGKKTDAAKDRDDRIRREKDMQNRDCGHSGPGPIYMLPPVLGYPNHDITRYRNPAFTAAGRPLDSRKKWLPPGPIYNPGSYNRFGAKFSPSVTFNDRTTYKTKSYGPGPAAYNVNANTIRPSAPKASLKGWEYKPPGSIGPGPAAYNPNTDFLYPTAPQASLKGRGERQNVSVGPGPGSYNPGFIGKRPPAAMVTSRPPPPTAQVGPGPAYNPKFIGPSPPAFSITGRPDPCVKPYIDKADDGLLEEYVPNPQRIPIA